MNSITTALVSIVTAIVSVAFLAVLVSRNSDTSKVIKSGGDAVSTMIAAAVSPVTGVSNPIGRFQSYLSENSFGGDY